MEELSLKSGLTAQEIKEIEKYMARYPEIEMAKVFGSRVLGSYKEASDVDIAILGEGVINKTAGNLKYDLEEDSYMPYFFDVISYNDIKVASLKEHIDKYGVVIYRQGWREVKLGDVVEFNIENLNNKCNWEFINYLDTSNITCRKIETIQLLDMKTDVIPSRAKRIVKEGDIVYSTVRPNQEHYGIIKNPVENLVVSTGFTVLRNKKELADNRFIYYLLTQKENTDYLSNVAEDSTTAYPSITPDVIINMDIILPPLAEQRAIASILSSLDNKIDLLIRQNKTLEALVETYFRQWFIEEANENWESGRLEDEFDIIMGQSPPGNTYNEGKNGLPFFQGCADFAFRFPTISTYCSAPQKTAEPFDTLLSVRAPVGDINMSYESCCIGRGLAIPKHKLGFKYYTFYKMKSLQEQFYLFDDDGTVFGSLSKDKFMTIETTIPPLDIVKKFNDFASIVDCKIYNNTTQIRTLAVLRDTLLPKLINGEVRVKM